MFEVMKCLAEGIAAHGVKGLLEMVPGGKYAHDIGAYAVKRYREKKAQKKLEDAVKEVIVAKADEALAEAKKAVEEAAPQLGEREKELVAQYLAGLPEAARQSLKRKDDPTGSSLPFGFTIHEPDDVVKLLPQHPPRFAPGEWVPNREDNWRLERRLGCGGFGEVWLARHHFKKSEKPRAVKFCTNANARTKLVTHEKQLVVRVMERAGDHPNIVPLLECHLSGETPWLMYEYVAGGTLADAILDWQKLAPAERLNRVVVVLHAIAGAVGHCHAMEPAIVHRDLKPANILMERDVPRITDFGIGGTAVDYLIAEERTHGYESVMGRLPSLLSGSYSLMYSSPQQRNRERPDPRDDVHALGVIAYQMLVGRVDAEVKGNWHRRLRGDGVPEALVDLIGASASDDADSRPADARAWETALQELRVVAKRPKRKRANKAPPVPNASAKVEQTPATAEEREGAQPHEPNALESETKAFADTAEQVGSVEESQTADEDANPPSSESFSEWLESLDFSSIATSEEESTVAPPEHPPAPKIPVTPPIESLNERLSPPQVSAVSVPAGIEERTRRAESVRRGGELGAVAMAYLENVTHQKYLEELRTKPVEVVLQWRLTEILVQLAKLSKTKGPPKAETLVSESTTVDEESLEPHADIREWLDRLAPPPSLVQEQVPRGRKWQIMVPGFWRARTRDNPSAEWRDVTSTPTEVTCVDDEVYLLSVSRTVTDAGFDNLVYLQGLTALDTLDIDFCDRLTDASLANLTELTTLKRLSACATNITDSGLAHLSRLPALELLDLTCTKVTDAGFVHLRGLTTLGRLDLGGCEGVTDAGIAALKEVLPNCDIER